MTTTTLKDYKTLFFAYIPKETQEKDLNNFINQEAKESPIQLNIVPSKDYQTLIAYVSFPDHESAQRAMEKLNGKEFNNSKLGVSWCIKDNRLKQIETNNVIFKCLDDNIDGQRVYDCCKKYGEILSYNLSCRKDKDTSKYVSNHVCFVKYAEGGSVDLVLSKKDEIRKELGAKVEIEKFEKRENKTNVYVCNIGKDISEKEFLEVFEKYGKIKEHNKDRKAFILCKKEKDENAPKFGYVDFENEDSAKNAINNLNDSKELGSDSLHVEIYLTRKERTRNRQNKKREIMEKIRGEYKENNLYIKRKGEDGKDGVPFSGEKEVREIFSKFGEIFSCRVKYENNQGKYSPASVAYVCYTTKQAAETASNAYQNNREFEIHVLKSRAQMRIENIMKNNNMFNLMGGMYSGKIDMLPFVFPQQMVQPHIGYPPQKKPKQPKPKQPKPKQPKPEQSKPEQSKPKPAEVQQPGSEDVIQQLGDDIYDYIEGLGKYSEDDIGRITGILLGSYQYADLKEKFDNHKIDPIIEDIVKNLNSN